MIFPTISPSRLELLPLLVHIYFNIGFLFYRSRSVCPSLSLDLMFSKAYKLKGMTIELMSTITSFLCGYEMTLSVNNRS